jgi:gamma-glutamyltranspeptidase/glutathione hydrolase
LATVLLELVERGAALFTGGLGEVVVARVQSAGGVLTTEDLVLPPARWQPAAHREVGGWDVWATPAPTHGPALLDAIERLQDRSGRAALDAVVGVADDHARLLADPLAPGGTSLVGAADATGTVVLLMHSNSYPRYGSGLVVDDLQLVLSNRAGRGFAADPGHPNHPATGRRPATTLHLWATGAAGDGPAFLGGTPGGANQMPWNAQVLHQLLAGERHPGRLVTAPRWEWDGPAATLTVEDGVAVDAVVSGTEREIAVIHRPALSLRSVQQVLCRPRPDAAIVGAADPRTGALAVPV